jgi:hypothetical protein
VGFSHVFKSVLASPLANGVQVLASYGRVTPSPVTVDDIGLSSGKNIVRRVFYTIPRTLRMEIIVRLILLFALDHLICGSKSEYRRDIILVDFKKNHGIRREMIRRHETWNMRHETRIQKYPCPM